MSVYKLYGTGDGDTDNDTASFDVQFNGDIVAIHQTITGNLDANDEYVNYEVSFLSTGTFTTNDARGSLFISGTRRHFTTSGGSNSTSNSSVSGLRIPVSAGERIHLHADASTGVSSSCHTYVYVDDEADATLRRRR